MRERKIKKLDRKASCSSIETYENVFRLPAINSLLPLTRALWGVSSQNGHLEEIREKPDALLTHSTTILLPPAAALHY